MKTKLVKTLLSLATILCGFYFYNSAIVPWHLYQLFEKADFGTGRLLCMLLVVYPVAICLLLIYGWGNLLAKEEQLPQAPQPETGTDETRDRRVLLMRTMRYANDEGSFDAYEDALAKYHHYNSFEPDYEVRVANHIKKDSVRLSINEQEDKERFDLYQNTYKTTYEHLWQYYEEYFGAEQDKASQS